MLHTLYVLESALYVTIRRLQSSNSTKPGQRNDSVVNSAVAEPVTPARNSDTGLARQRRDEY